MIVMKIIEWLSDRIEEEICDAHTYCEKAIMVKQDYPRLADTLMKISEDELKHMALLHNEVVDIIEEYRRNTGDPPPEMLAVYEYLHKKQIEKTANVKAMQSQYRS